jgi:hypothetical protein
MIMQVCCSWEFYLELFSVIINWNAVVTRRKLQQAKKLCCECARDTMLETVLPHEGLHRPRSLLNTIYANTPVGFELLVKTMSLPAPPVPAPAACA